MGRILAYLKLPEHKIFWPISGPEMVFWACTHLLVTLHRDRILGSWCFFNKLRVIFHFRRIGRTDGETGDGCWWRASGTRTTIPTQWWTDGRSEWFAQWSVVVPRRIWSTAQEGKLILNSKCKLKYIRDSESSMAHCKEINDFSLTIHGVEIRLSIQPYLLHLFHIFLYWEVEEYL